LKKLSKRLNLGISSWVTFKSPVSLTVGIQTH
jgi:hypothetical protein